MNVKKCVSYPVKGVWRSVIIYGNNSRLKFRHEFFLGHVCLQKLLVSFEKILPKSNGSNQKKIVDFDFLMFIIK